MVVIHDRQCARGVQQEQPSEWSNEPFSQPTPDNPAFSVDMKSQADIYQALLSAVNSRLWITGFISRGYYPPTILQDKSASIHGKPAADILWYWYPRLLGVVR